MYTLRCNATFIVCDVSQQWILDPDDLMRERQEDLAVLSQEEYQKIIIFFANCMYNLVVIKIIGFNIKEKAVFRVRELVL